MKVYLVWDGYEDVVAVFLSEDKAKAFVDNLVENGAKRYNLAIDEMDVVTDARP